jgi:arylsulfatase A-like enzyme
MELRPSDDDLYRSAYRNRQQEIQLPETWAPWASCEPKLPREIYNHRWIPDYDYVKRPQELRERIVRQCQVITGVDRVIGRLRQSLEAIGEADNTIIIFSTDHGLFFGEHGLGGKALLYEPALRIPLIIYDPRPGRRKGQRSDAMVAVPDLAPTVLDLCGIDATPGMQGTSIAPILTGSTTPIRDELFVENLYDDQNYPRCQGLIGERFKYLSYFKRHEDPAQDGRHLRATLDDYESCRKTMSADEAPVHEELFDLNEDPGECHNLAGYADQQDRLAHMRQRCRAAAARLLPGGKPDTVVRTLPT